MLYILEMRHYFLWIIIAVAVALNFSLKILLEQPNGHDIFYSFPLTKTIRYSDYLFQKWNLAIVAFLIFGWWLKRGGNLTKAIRENAPFIIILVLVTFSSHIFSFNRWFEFDDYRVIGHHFAVEGTPRQNQMGAGSSYYYGIGLVYLVVGWFGTHFELYNALGLFIYSLICITIFFFAKRLGANKVIACLIGLFFVTSPTYYRETLIMLELLGDGFKLLLFSLSCFLLIAKFYPGSVIFAVAALEFGISRTHFIALPLILICLLFKNKKEVGRDWIFALLSFFTMSFMYVSALGTHPPKIIDQTNWISNFPQLLRIADTIFGVTIQHPIIYTGLSFFKWLLGDYPYVSPIIGGLIVVFFLYLSFWLLIKKRLLQSKLIFLGIVIVVSAIIFPTLMGIRLVYKIDSLTAQYNDIFPAAPTSYGVFSAFGITFILLGISEILRRKLFVRILLILIILNTITLLKSDYDWAKIISQPQRAVNVQLNNLLPYDGKTRVIYTPPPTQILSRYISYFHQLYRIKESLNFTNDPQEFIRLLDEYKPSKERVYILIFDTETNEIIDFSYKLRGYYPDKKITPEILTTLIE